MSLRGVSSGVEGQESHSAAVLRYVELGWSVIPIERGGKRPLVRWVEFQSRRASVEEVRGWWGRWAGSNVGVVTGQVSGIVVLDVDGREGDESLRRCGALLPATVVCATGRGVHYYFKHPGKPVPNRARVAPGLDVRGDGGYVVVPPSVHPSGRAYSWAPKMGAGDVEIADVPRWLARMLEGPAKTEGSRLGSFLVHLLRGVTEGERNDAAARLAGRLLGCGLAARDVLEWLLLWNERNKPPLSREEIEQVVRSIARREAQRLVL